MSEEIFSNWVHLTYDWGFPPEIEREDWLDFQVAAQAHHQAGSHVFAYIQTSNCVYSGSFIDQEWYAQSPKGKKIFYYSGRYRTCLTHPTWVAHLKEMVAGAIERQADGIFLDNLWHGAMPLQMFNSWLGAAGCHCARCQEAYRAESGQAIPTRLRTGDPNARRYLKWRAAQVTQLVKDLGEYAQSLQPGTPISCNDYEMFSRDSYLVFGQDLKALAQIQDIVMVENHALLRWQTGGDEWLYNNALVIRNVRALMAPHAHLSLLSYDSGIGFDDVYSRRRYQQAIAEAAACGASMTIKGTEYFHNGKHTTLLPEEFAPQRKAIGKFNRWLEANSALFEGGQSAAPIGLLFPGESLWLDWLKLAKLYQGAGQVLTLAGLPWKTIVCTEDLSFVRVLLVFDLESLARLDPPKDLEVIYLPDLPGWEIPSESFTNRIPLANRIAAGMAHGLLDLYMSSRSWRSVLDRIEILQSGFHLPVFRVPTEALRRSLIEALPQDLYPRLHAGKPALIEVWQRPDELQIHLINYADQLQPVQVSFPEIVQGELVSPDSDQTSTVVGKVIELELDIFQILRIRQHLASK